MLCFHLINTIRLSAKTSELGQFLLDFQQTYVPLAVRDVGRCVEFVLTTISLIQFLKLEDLSTETGDLFA